MNQMRVQIKKKKVYWWARSKADSEKPEVEYLPGPGNHFFYYNGKKMWAYSQESEPLVVGWERKPTKQEKLYIMCSGSDTSSLKKLVQEALEYN